MPVSALLHHGVSCAVDAGVPHPCGLLTSGPHVHAELPATQPNKHTSESPTCTTWSCVSKRLSASKLLWRTAEDNTMMLADLWLFLG